ncbi:MAG: sigma 54-interacting transcriptional regulator, partial [Comamonas sp.]|nr:sigma 54-interacting transcriptional regulator [Comamonas sp.]
VRVIAATHADLADQVERGQFRRDLYYRLAVLRLSTPTLQQRGASDVAELAHRMLAQRLGAQALQGASHKALASMLDAVLLRAQAYSWPGNVRELDNWVERLLACRHYLAPSAQDGAAGPDAARLLEIFPECAPLVPLAASEAARKTRLKDAARQAERQRVREVLESVDGDQGRACEILGISRATLWRRLNQA